MQTDNDSSTREEQVRKAKKERGQRCVTKVVCYAQILNNKVPETAIIHYLNVIMM